MLKTNFKAIFLLLAFSCCALISAAQIDISLPSAPTTDVPAPTVDIEKKKTTTTTTTTTTSTTTTVAPTVPTTPSTTSTTPATTAAPETTTTSTPSPTTKAPDTTTTSTTSTTTAAPVTTTAAPVTTTAAPVTTTAAPPKPYPAPSIGTWNSSCVMLKLAAQLNFTYETKDNKTATALYNIPADAKVEDAHCDMNTTQFIQINWGPQEAQSSMNVQFDKKNQTAEMTMLYFVLALTADEFPNAKVNESIKLIHRGHDFAAPAKMSYHCTRAQEFNLTETINDKDIIGTVMMRDVQVEAFRAGNSTMFSTVHDCDSAQTSDIVPIAVGIALAALIAIVLVAYLCARRRTSSRGYMSF